MSEYAVVLFSYDECYGEGATPGMRCVMEVHGPFPNRPEADAYADTVPGFVPHIMALHPPVTKGSTDAACEWCGRAIDRDEQGRWYAVKGAERGYDPLVCDAVADRDDTDHAPTPRGSGS